MNNTTNNKSYNKKNLIETDIISKYIIPAVEGEDFLPHQRCFNEPDIIQN